MTPFEQAVSNLGATRRHAVVRALAESRDRWAGELGDPAIAEVWHQVALAVAEVDDRERALLMSLAQEMTPVAELMPEDDG